MYCGVEEEENEIFVIIPADTVAHPGTVVIHPYNTGITYFAVVNPRMLDQLAPLTVGDLLHLFYLLWTRFIIMYSASKRGLRDRLYFLLLLWIYASYLKRWISAAENCLF